MREIKKVLCTAYINDENKKKLVDALYPAQVDFIIFIDKDKIKEKVLKENYDVCIANGDLDESMLLSNNLKWIHCCRAGVDKSAKDEIFDRNIILTTSSGRSSSAIAEHALMFMLSLTYDVPMLERAKKDHVWAVSKEYYTKTGMFKKTLGILGVGKNGRELARLVKPFDMRVLGYDRTSFEAENFDQVLAGKEGLDYILKESDYVVVCLELNDATHYLLNKNNLSLLKKTAILINVGRGEIINEEDLIDCLNNRIIAACGLDTFVEEPLGKDSPLWDFNNVMITPHITPQLPDKEERMLSYVFDNIKAYKNETPFVNLVKRESIYRG